MDTKVILLFVGFSSTIIPGSFTITFPCDAIAAFVIILTSVVPTGNASRIVASQSALQPVGNGFCSGK